MHAHSVAVFDRQLAALSAILTKAEAHCEARKIEPAALLTARLFPDMFTLTRQIQLATDFAKGPASRLAGDEVPSYEDTEAGFAQLQDRITRTRAHLATLGPDRYAGAETRIVKFRARGQDHELPGAVYLERMALPNFWFHVTTAYNILRHNGVELSKGDFLGV